MKRPRTIWVTLVTLLPLLGCEEFVNPKTDVRGIPVLYCTISTTGENSGATPEAVLTRVYDVDGLDPSENRIDPSIPGADITLSLHGISYQMKEDSLRRSDTSRYTTKQRYYWTVLQSLNPGDSVSLSARTPQREMLIASAKVPQSQQFETSIEFASGFTSKVNTFQQGNEWTFTWRGDEDDIFFPKLKLWYRKFSGGVGIPFSREVPLSFVVRNSAATPVFPTSQWDNSVSYALSSFDSIMTQISVGDTDKTRYKVDFLTFSLVEYDRSLSRYYSSVRGYLDEYSVRLDESIYTNVNGGIGVFGCSRTTSLNYPVNLGYVRSFGYQ